MRKIREKLELATGQVAVLLMFLTILGVSAIAGLWIYSNVVTVTVSEAELTLNQPANVARYQIVDFTGGLQWSNGTKISGANVTLEINDAGSWVKAGWALTDVNGNYSILWNASVVGIFDFRTKWLS